MTSRKRKSTAVNKHLISPTIILGLTSIFLLILQLAFANSLSSKGRDINRLENEKEDLVREVSAKDSILVSLGSLERVRADALKLGMIEGSDNFEYLVPPKFAYKQ